MNDTHLWMGWMARTAWLLVGALGCGSSATGASGGATGAGNDAAPAASDEGGAGAPGDAAVDASGDEARPIAGDAAAPPDGGGPGGDGGFVHPGIMVDQGMLDRVKSEITAGTQPWSGAMAAAAASPFGAATYTPQPIATVQCGSYSNPDIGCTAEKNDAIAAYTHALLWAYTGDVAHAQKAIQIMNAWSAVLQAHTDSNAPLQSAWVAEVFPRAAEIIRYSGAGWSAADVAQFSAMLRNVYLPEVIGGAPRDNGNWELSMAEATMNIGVFLDDAATFQKAVAMWRARVPAYVYVTSDGPTPVLPPGGAVTASKLASFWFNQTKLVDGVCQETCRDLGHVQYGLAAMVNAAETARIQGIDLYSEQKDRIVAGLELHAQFLDGAAVPSWLCGGTLSAVTPDPMWEVAFNAYANRLGAAMPQTQALVARIRPTAADHHMDWETLTHAGIGDAGL